MQPARIHCTINGKMSQNTMEDYHYLAEGNAYRSDPKIIHKEATIKMLRVLSGDKNVDDTEEILKALDGMAALIYFIINYTLSCVVRSMQKRRKRPVRVVAE